jgi:hypothetical protein
MSRIRRPHQRRFAGCAAPCDPHGVSISTESPATDGYIPGTCNIGKAEIRQRQVVSLIGLAFAVTSAVGLIAADAPWQARLGVFAPLMVWAVGMVQARRKFCMAYGLLGTFNLARLGKVSRVTDPAMRRIDRIAALRILMESTLWAAAVTAVFVVLPV